MVILPMIAIGLKAATWAIAAGPDGRTVYHTHAWGHIGDEGCKTPYSSRLWAIIRGHSTLEYTCPFNDSPIVNEHIIWPHG